MDRPHRGPAGPALADGAPVTADLSAVAAAHGTTKIVEARDLFLSFGETPALRGASLGVRPGEIVAVMGPSGSGKSTLLHCLAGILVPDEGQVWFGGQRLDTLSDDRRSALRRSSLSVSSRCPPNQTCPSSGTRMPARQCSRVDLPEPLGPMTATISPGRTPSEAPRSAGVSPNERNRSRASTIFVVPCAAATADRSAVTGAPSARAGPAGPRCGRSIEGQPPVGRARGQRGAPRVDPRPA